MIVLGATDGEAAEAFQHAIEELHASTPRSRSCSAARPSAVRARSRNGMRVLERIDEAVEAVEQLLATRPRATSL